MPSDWTGLMWLMGCVFLFLAWTFYEDDDRAMAWIFGMLGFFMLIGVFD